MDWQCYWWRKKTCDLLEHRRISFGYTGWGCNEGKRLCIHSGAGRTGQRNEPAGMSRSRSLTPVVGQRNTWQRGLRGPLHITLQLTLSHFHDTPQTVCWGSRGTLTCSGWETVAWDHQGLMSEWHSSPPEQLQRLDLSPPHWHLCTTVSPLAGWSGLLDTPQCSWSHGTETWRLWLWHPSLKYHPPTCEENMLVKSSQVFSFLNLVIVIFLYYSRNVWEFLSVSVLDWWITEDSYRTHHCELYEKVGWSSLTSRRYQHNWLLLYKALLSKLLSYLIV